MCESSDVSEYARGYIHRGCRSFGVPPCFFWGVGVEECFPIWDNWGEGGG